MEIMKRLVREEEGQGLVEYALVLGVISIALIAGSDAIRTAVAALWTKIAAAIK
ncbi:Flp family type IVb pilin [Trichococcus shcherbakoviae]|uniref:Flp family type IVb pilin n=1 Tax=Trichococcus shcherbakoviae TaxID=2094020 RepID=UPI002AA6C488|nr:Flp family type IVb pilin [Trichococcus shcherbakoviae]